MKNINVYHVYPRGVRRGDLFTSPDHHAIFETLLDRYAVPCGVEVYAVCEMSNHYHMLLGADPLAKSLFLKKLNWAYAFIYNQNAKLSGHVFERSGASGERMGEALLVHIVRYIVMNPVAARMVRRPEQYPYSTYLAMLGKTEAPSYLKPERILRFFSEDPKTGREQFRAYVESSIGKIDFGRAVDRWDATYNGSSRARHMRAQVEYAAWTSSAIWAAMPEIRSHSGLLFTDTDVKILAMWRVCQTSVRVMGAVLGLAFTAVHKKLQCMQRVIGQDPALADELDLALRTALVRH